MKYIFDFVKIISVTGWIIYLIKFVFEDFMEYKLINCIWVVIFLAVFRSINTVENWWKNR